MERLRAMPGVESVGLVQELPLDEGAGTGRFATEHTEASGGRRSPHPVTHAGGDYFKTMGIPLVSGRLFERGDDALRNEPTQSSAARPRQLLWPARTRLASACDSARTRRRTLGRRLSASSRTSGCADSANRRPIR